jgi:hypothetical protein
VLCKKQVQQETTEVRAEIMAKKPSGWKAWIMAQQVLKF